MSVNYDILPEHLRERAQNYIEHGKQPLGFMCSALANNFADAMIFSQNFAQERMDREQMVMLAKWLFTECPINAWGSYSKVDAWTKTFEKNDD